MSEAKALSTIEVSKILGLAVGTIQKMVDSGELEGWKTTGGHRRISADSVDAFVNSRLGESRSATAKTKPVNSNGEVCFVVEDSVFYATLLKDLISNQFPSLQVQTIHDGFDAITALGKTTPVLITLDLDMPGLDGQAVFKKITSTHPQLKERIVIITQLENDDLANSSALFGNTPIINKSHVNSDLPSILSRIIGDIHHADA